MTTTPTPPRKRATPTPPRGRGRPRQERPTRPRALPENLTDAELIARAIDKSAPMTDREFAETILLCHPRTLRKYLQEGRTLPPLAREKLLDLVRNAPSK